MSGESTLREKAREAIRAGRLPDRPPDRTWGGPGLGADCAICRAPVNHDEVEIEIEFDQGDDGCPGKSRLHVRCFAAWEFELDQMQSMPNPASMAGRRSSPGTTASAGVLPGMASGRKMAGNGCDTTYKRDPG